MQARMAIKIGIMCSALFVGGGAHAQALWSDPDGLPYNDIEVTSDGIAYVAGGIGIEEQERLNARANHFNLKLVFTLHEGNYIADVNVAVKDANENTVVVEEMADGPFFLAKIPRGRYTVIATYDGKRVTRTMQVGDRLRTAYLRWPSNPKTDFILSREHQVERKAGTGPQG